MMSAEEIVLDKTILENRENAPPPEQDSGEELKPSNFDRAIESENSNAGEGDKEELGAQQSSSTEKETLTSSNESAGDVPNKTDTAGAKKSPPATSNDITEKPKPELPDFLRKEMDPSTPSLSFAETLMTTLMEPKNSDIMTFLPDKTTFGILKLKKFAEGILGNYFGMSTYSSFVRKLKRWGFVRVGDHKTFDMAFYRHPQFKQGDWDVCANIKPGGRHCKQESYKDPLQTESIMLQTKSLMLALANSAEESNKRKGLEMQSLSAEHPSKKSKSSESTNVTDCLVPAIVERQTKDRMSEVALVKRSPTRVAEQHLRPEIHSLHKKNTPKTEAIAETKRQLSEAIAKEKQLLNALENQQRGMPNELEQAQRCLSGLGSAPTQHQRRLSDAAMQMQGQLGMSGLGTTAAQLSDATIQMETQRRLSGLGGTRSPQRRQLPEDLVQKEVQRCLSALGNATAQQQRRLSDAAIQMEAQRRLSGVGAQQQRPLSDAAIQMEVQRRLSGERAQQQRRLSDAAIQMEVQRRLSGERAQQQRRLSDAAIQIEVQRRLSGERAQQQRRLSDAAIQMEAQRRLSGVGGMSEQRQRRLSGAAIQIEAQRQRSLSDAAMEMKVQRHFSCIGGLAAGQQRRLSDAALQMEVQRRLSGFGDKADAAVQMETQQHLSGLGDMGAQQERKFSGTGLKIEAHRRFSDFGDMSEVALQMEAQRRFSGFASTTAQGHRRLSDAVLQMDAKQFFSEGIGTKQQGRLSDAAIQREVERRLSGMNSKAAIQMEVERRLSGMGNVGTQRAQQHRHLSNGGLQQAASQTRLSSGALKNATMVNVSDRAGPIFANAEQCSQVAANAVANLSHSEVDNVTQNIVGNALAALRQDPSAPSLNMPLGSNFQSGQLSGGSNIMDTLKQNTLKLLNSSRSQMPVGVGVGGATQQSRSAVLQARNQLPM